MFGKLLRKTNWVFLKRGLVKKGEMASLPKIIQPTMGVLTNLGEAHAEGFSIGWKS